MVKKIKTSTYNTLTCLFGHHDYSDKTTKDKDGDSIYLCKHCQRSGYRTWSDGDETWHDYDEKGNCVHSKWSDGLEVWLGYDEKGNCVHIKWSDGDEVWYDEKGGTIRERRS